MIFLKLSVSISDLTDPVMMTEVREDLDIGSISPLPGCNKGIEAKLRIAEVLDIKINKAHLFTSAIYHPP